MLLIANKIERSHGHSCDHVERSHGHSCDHVTDPCLFYVFTF